MKQVLTNSNGIIKVKDNEDKVSKSTLYALLKENKMLKIAPGVYASPEVIVDDAFILLQRCPRGVISHEDALYYHGLIEREPFVHSITIYTGYNPSRLTNSGYKVYTVKKELLDIGKISVKNHFGNEVAIYDLERTICDLFKNRNSFEKQDFNTAIKTYASRLDKDLNKLMRYAKKFKVDKIIRQYMEVLI